MNTANYNHSTTNDRTDFEGPPRLPAIQQQRSVIDDTPAKDRDGDIKNISVASKYTCTTLLLPPL